MGMNGTNEKRISKWPWHVGYERIAVDEDDMLCIYDADNVKIADMVGYTDDDDAHAMLMTAAPELREELERIIRKTCVTCKGETLTAIQGTKSPCEDGRPCPYGLDGARQAIAKSYGQDTTITDCRQ